MATKNLVVMPFGNTSIKSDWIFDNTDREFDVVLLFYHATINSTLLQSSEAFKIFHLQDFKWPMIQRFFKENPLYLNQYEYFFFPDDDIEIDVKTIDVIFKWTNEFRLQLSQPVLTRDSHKSWRVLRKKFLSGVRYLSAVELMCPVMSRQAIQELSSTFSLNRSGWGIDILWGELIRKKFGDKSIAVFDLLAAKHTKPVGKGELYNKLEKSAVEERDEIFEKYQIKTQKIFALAVSENRFLNKLKSYFYLSRQLA